MTPIYSSKRINFNSFLKSVNILLFLFCIVTSIKANSSIFEMSPQNLNLGDINQGHTAPWKVEIKNNSTENLHIDKVKTSCVCTKVEIKNEDLAPGQLGEITGIIETGKFDPGNFSKLITAEWSLQSGIKGASETIIKGNIKMLALILPSTLDFGTIADDKIATNLITVSRGDSLKNWDSISAWSEKLSPEIIKNNNNEFIIKVIYKPNTLPLGPIHEVIYTKLLDKGGMTVLKFQTSIIGKITGDISAKPESLFLGVVTPNRIIETKLLLQSREGKSLSLISMETSNDKIATLVKLPSREDALAIKCTVNPSSAEGNISGLIKIKIKTDREAEIIIPYIGYVKKT